jgi:hypothetical protein
MNALYRTGAGARQDAYTTLNSDPNEASDNHYYGSPVADSSQGGSQNITGLV